MTITNTPQASARQGNDWLKPYYFARAAFSILWVLAAFTVGRSVPAIAAALLMVYPAWDAAANFADAQRNGGLLHNRSQALNMAVSGVATAAVAIALGMGMNAVLGVFGVWAILAGALQLATGVRRWKTHGAQWAMVLSGAQSALAGGFFIHRASASTLPGVADIAPYAAFGAIYFLVSAVWLAVSDLRGRQSASSRA